MPTKKPTETKTAKPKVKREQVKITYKDQYGDEHTHDLTVPVRPGHGEAILNEADRRGCPDIADVRKQIQKHYH